MNTTICEFVAAAGYCLWYSDCLDKVCPHAKQQSRTHTQIIAINRHLVGRPTGMAIFEPAINKSRTFGAGKTDSESRAVDPEFGSVSEFGTESQDGIGISDLASSTSLAMAAVLKPGLKSVLSGIPVEHTGRNVGLSPDCILSNLSNGEVVLSEPCVAQLIAGDPFWESLPMRLAGVCPVSCNTPEPQSQEVSLPPPHMRGASIEHVSACDYLARNGLCEDGVLARMELMRSIGGVPSNGGSVDSPLQFTTRWDSGDVREYCQFSCGTCASDSIPSDHLTGLPVSSYGKEANSFCTDSNLAAIFPDADGLQVIGGDHSTWTPFEAANPKAPPPTPIISGIAYSTNLLYQPICCGLDSNGESYAVWPRLVESVYGTTNAFVVTNCGQIASVPTWIVILYLLAASFFAVLVGYARLRIRWVLIASRMQVVRAPLPPADAREPDRKSVV